MNWRFWMKDADQHFHFHHTFHFGDTTVMHAKLDVIKRQGEIIMGKIDEAIAELEAANQATNEIAAAVSESATDIDDILAKLAAGGGDQAQLDALLERARANTAALRAQAEAARAVAAKHTP
jgi:hypothetical protein